MMKRERGKERDIGREAEMSQPTVDNGEKERGEGVRSCVHARGDDPCVLHHERSWVVERRRHGVGRRGGRRCRAKGEVKRGGEGDRQGPKSNEQDRQASRWIIDDARVRRVTIHPAWISPECGEWSSKSAEARRRGPTRNEQELRS